MIRNLGRYIIISIILAICIGNTKLIANKQESHTEKEKKKEKKIVVIIPSYNNKDWYKKNLDSIFMQTYENYSIIYINDKSPDGTGQLVREYVKNANQEHRFTLINNPKNTGALANIYKAVHTCDDNTIIVTVDGDDWLNNDTVFQTINRAYQDPHIWLTYGQYQELHYSKKHKKYFTKKGLCRQIPPNIIRANAYREDKWSTSHLRTFYAGLFKQIKLQDLLEQSDFYQVTWDMAFMIPMLEMAKGKYKFIDDILYDYNCITPINDFKTKLIKQLHLEHVIRAKEKYKQIQSPYKLYTQDKRVDIIIISSNSPNSPILLYATLESIEYFLSGVKNIYILYEKENSKLEQTKRDFSNAYFIPYTNLKKSLEETLGSINTTYILLAKENIIVKDFIELKECIELLDQTYAYGFYLSLGKNIQENNALVKKQTIPPHTEIKAGIYAWQFQDGKCDWKIPNNLLMTLYKKEDIQKSLQEIAYNSVQSLEQNMNRQKFDAHQAGLFFQDSKVINLAPNTEEKTSLLESFKKGMRINILPIFLSKNNSILCKTSLSFYKGESDF